MRCREPENRAAALAAVIPRLPGDLLERPLDVVLDLMSSAPYVALEPMVAVISRLPPDLLDELPWRQEWIRARNRSRCVQAAEALFCSDDRADGARQALKKLGEDRELFEEAHEDQQGQFIAALLPHLPPGAFDGVLAAVRRAYDLDAALIALARHAPAERLGDLLNFAARQGPARLEFIRQVAPRLTAQELPAALRMCRAIESYRDRALAFAELAPHLDDGQARVLLAPGRGLSRRGEPPRRFPPALPEAGQATSGEKLQGNYSYGFALTSDLGLYHGKSDYFAIGALLDRLPREVARAAVADLIIPLISRQATAYGTSAGLFQFENRRAFAAVAPYLSADHRRNVLTEIFTAISFSRSDAEAEVPFLARFAPLSEDEVAAAFTVLENAHPYSWWPQSAQMMADVLALNVRKRVLEKIPAHMAAFPVERECFAALAALGQLEPGTTRDHTAARALAIATSIPNPRHKADAITELVPVLLREDLVAKAFDTLKSIGPLAGLWAIDAMADVLPPALLRAAAQKAVAGRPFTKPAKDVPRILGRLAEMGDMAVIDSVLPHPNNYEEVTRLAPLLSASQARRIWSFADEESLHDAQAESLAALVSRLPEPERPAAVDKVLAAYRPVRSDGVQARILGRLARVASTERLTATLGEYLSRRGPGTLTDQVLAELAPGLPETLIEEAFQYALSDDYESSRALAELAPRLSGSLLTQAIAHVSQAGRKRGTAAALTALAQQLPQDHQDRETLLSMALDAAGSWPSFTDRVMAQLIPQLPERLRSRGVKAAMDEACSDLLHHDQTHGERFDRLHALLAVLRQPELAQLYAQLQQVKVPRVRARAQAAVIRQAGARHAESFFTDGPPLHNGWSTDSDRAGLMDLIAAAAWWIHQHGEDSDIDEVIQAICDVTRWWS